MAVLVVVIVVKVCVGVLKVLMVNLYSQCTMIVMCDVEMASQAGVLTVYYSVSVSFQRRYVCMAMLNGVQV